MMLSLDRRDNPVTPCALHLPILRTVASKSMPWKRNGYMNYTLLRNAAALLTVGGTSFLIDPALEAAGARPPVPNTPNQHPNPLVDLPPGWEDIVASGDALLVTHLHRDHFDDASGAQL